MERKANIGNKIVPVSHQTCESAVPLGDYRTSRRCRPVGTLRSRQRSAWHPIEWLCTYAVPRVNDGSEAGPCPGVCSTLGLWTRPVFVNERRRESSPRNALVLSCESI